MDNAKNQIADIIKNNANILVSVSTDPSVDELSAALGLTILLNNMDKRATAVFSGAIPPAIDFMEPGKTFENTADSLRDFIIALDKEKADHLRYKVEGDVVKIFITPYKSNLSKDDLEFSQGDYNVEVVIGLGVKDQDHLDKALEAHGKILHDANVMTITAGPEVSNLGAIDWHEAEASSLSEMIVGLADALKQDKPLLDEQISTALLTGIVSSTERFSNDKTTSRAMTIAAQLMAAGANQQLIAAKLEEAHDIEPNPAPASDEAVKTDEPAPEQSSEPTNELSIKRSERSPKSDESVDAAITSVEPGLDFEAAGIDLNPTNEPTEEKSEETQSEESQSEPPAEEDGQAELEKQLAELNAPPAGTLADIEKELAGTVEAPVEEPAPEEPKPEPQTASVQETDVKTEEPVLPELPTLPTLDRQPEMPALEPLPTLEPLPEPQIINEHGTFTEKPENESAPINSIQSDPNEGEATIDPFNDTTATITVPPLEPLSSDVGTPEGAAMLAGNPAPAPTPLSEPITIPPLPPLPPLPPDVSVPLPPPLPPPPVFDPTPATNPNQSGAVSGDVFGDGTTIAPQQPAPAPSEPGQFKIPGQ